MKKTLLLAAAALAAMPSFAYVEDATYPETEGYTFKNISMNTQLNGNLKELINTPGNAASLGVICSGILVDKTVYIGTWSTIAEDGTAAGINSLMMFSAENGEYLGSRQLTLDGQPWTESMGTYRIGRDDYDNLYIMPIVLPGNADYAKLTDPENVKIYTVDVETGAVTPQLQYWLEEFAGLNGRLNWIDIVGDVTRQQAGCVVMGAPQSGDNKAAVYGWEYAKGAAGNDWEGHFEYDWGKGEALSIPEESIPVELGEKGIFNGATYLQIVRDEEHSASQFYVDDMYSYPNYFNTGGALLGSFNALKGTDNAGLIPDMTPNGIAEFSFGDDIFVTYILGDWNKGSYSNICRLGEGADFLTMTKLFTYPQSDMGDTSDTGRRLSSYDIKVVEDNNGKHGAYIMHYKSGMGFTYNLFAEKGFEDPAAVGSIEVDENAPVEYFNLQGIRVEEPANGIFIRRQGASVTKVIR